MSADDSVSFWIGQLTAGDASAARHLWERYFHRLVGLARRKLAGRPRRAADEEDVALSAFHSFFRGAERGRFPSLLDRHNLWRLLVAITARKASHLVRDEGRAKRGGGRVHDLGGLPEEEDFEEILDRAPTPEFAAQLADEYRRLMACLEDAELKSVAVWKMEGYTNDEIAAKLACVPRTVERKLRLIRSIWAGEVGP